MARAVLCRHCRRRKRKRHRRGLCKRCHLDPAVRALYPTGRGPGAAKGVSVPQRGRKGVRDTGYERPLPRGATLAPPGSEEKIEVLCQRARLRQQLWHPADLTLRRGD